MQTNNDACLLTVLKWFAIVCSTVTLMNMLAYNDIKYVIVPILLIVIAIYPSMANEEHGEPIYKAQGNDSYAYSNYWDKLQGKNNGKTWEKNYKDAAKKCRRNFTINISNDNHAIQTKRQGRSPSKELHEETQNM